MSAPGRVGAARRNRLRPARLRLLLLLFFLALVLPTAVLIRQAYSQLQWEAFHQQRLLAEAMVSRIDRRLTNTIDIEEARSVTDYGFLVLEGDAEANFVRRSPLSDYPWPADIPGLLGYFQIDARDRFSTPLLPGGTGEPPSGTGLSAADLAERRALENQILGILSRNQLAGEEARVSVLEESVATALGQDGIGVDAAGRDEQKPQRSQSAFDLLSEAESAGDTPPAQSRSGGAYLGRVEDLQLDLDYEEQSRLQAPKKSAASKLRYDSAPPQAQRRLRATRKEKSLLAEPYPDSLDDSATALAGGEAGVKIALFESEVAPFELSLLPSGHFVLYRKVWREGQRYIQGLLIEQQRFIDDLVGKAFRETALSRAASLAVGYEGAVVSAFGAAAQRDGLRAADLRGALLLRTDLSAPFQALELVYSVSRLPIGPGGRVIAWSAVVLALVLCGGIYLLYRLALRQMALADQQQDFVSAVSHELKTPITSIRMYGEMLKQGWADEEKKREYYDFIYSESERLSRLIENVLQLARMTRNDLQVSLAPVGAGELLDLVRSKIASQIDRAGFALHIRAGTEARVQVDADLFTQIVINLVDNAIKFSARSPVKKIELGSTCLSSGEVVFTVRDYGPGIPGNQMKRIFQLFYRSENELTRETTGTGIGLALVDQLARTMGGKVDVVNCEPGTEFRILFPAA